MILKVYLIGGLGNNLFQIDYGLRQSKGQEVVFLTNIIDEPIYNRVFGWTYHTPDIYNINLNKVINLKKENFLRFLFDLFFLFLARLFKKNIFGVSWNSPEISRSNFGYFQDLEHHRNKTFSLAMQAQGKVYDTVIHFRLGDSPTLNLDVNKQLNLLKKLQLSDFKVVTNDIAEVTALLQNYDFKFEILGGNVLEDLKILMLTKRLIAPQSTFSLVAALMSDNLQELYIDKQFWTSKGRNIPRLNIKYY